MWRSSVQQAPLPIKRFGREQKFDFKTSGSKRQAAAGSVNQGKKRTSQRNEMIPLFSDPYLCPLFSQRCGVLEQHMETDRRGAEKAILATLTEGMLDDVLQAFNDEVGQPKLQRAPFGTSFIYRNSLDFLQKDYSGLYLTPLMRDDLSLRKWRLQTPPFQAFPEHVCFPTWWLLSKRHFLLDFFAKILVMHFSRAVCLLETVRIFASTSREGVGGSSSSEEELLSSGS